MEKDSRMTTWYKHHYTTTSITSKRDEMVCLLGKGSLKNAMWDHLGKEHEVIQRQNEHSFTVVAKWEWVWMEEDTEWHSTQHDFLGSIFGQSILTWPEWLRCSLLSLQFGCFFNCETLISFLSLVTSEPFCVLHRHYALCTLCCTSLWTLTNGLKYFANVWQMPEKCHTQLPSGSGLHRGGQQMSPCFCPVWGTRGRTIWALFQQRC